MLNLHKISFFFMAVLTTTGVLLLVSFFTPPSNTSYIFSSTIRIFHNAAAISILLLFFLFLLLSFWFSFSKRTTAMALVIFGLLLLNIHLGLIFDWEILTHNKIANLANVAPIALHKDKVTLNVKLLNGVIFLRRSEILAYVAHGVIVPAILLFFILILKKKSGVS